MHLHIITSGEINNLKDSKLASDRLRLDYICKAAKKIGYHITGGLNIPNADIYLGILGVKLKGRPEGQPV